MKTTVDVEDLKVLYSSAKSNSTLDKWAELALEWIEYADEEIKRLTKQLSEK